MAGIINKDRMINGKKGTHSKDYANTF